jgi:hypothetical protein
VIVALVAAPLLGGALASADPPQASDTASPQIGQAGSSHRDSGADQISTNGPTTGGAARVGQLPSAPQPVAQSQLTGPAASRNTHTSAIGGHDRCDPASPEARNPDCARIPENRAEDFQPKEPQGEAHVDPSAPSGDLVNGILSSGTGTVVQLPPK